MFAERVAATGSDMDRLADLLFDAALCGIGELTGRVLDDLGRAVGAAADLGSLGRTLTVVLAMWRHDGLFHAGGGATLGAVVTAAVHRALWLAEGVRGGPAPADLRRIAAVIAVRDALTHAATRSGSTPRPRWGSPTGSPPAPRPRPTCAGPRSAWAGRCAARPSRTPPARCAARSPPPRRATGWPGCSRSPVRRSCTPRGCWSSSTSWWGR